MGRFLHQAGPRQCEHDHLRTGRIAYRPERNSVACRRFEVEATLEPAGVHSDVGNSRRGRVQAPPQMWACGPA